MPSIKSRKVSPIACSHSSRLGRVPWHSSGIVSYRVKANGLIIGTIRKLGSDWLWEVTFPGQRANLALFRKKLAEPHTDAEHRILLKLQADEEAKDRPSEPK